MMQYLLIVQILLKRFDYLFFKYFIYLFEGEKERERERERTSTNRGKGRGSWRSRLPTDLGAQWGLNPRTWRL